MVTYASAPAATLAPLTVRSSGVVKCALGRSKQSDRHALVGFAHEMGIPGQKPLHVQSSSWQGGFGDSLRNPSVMSLWTLRECSHIPHFFAMTITLPRAPAPSLR